MIIDARLPAATSHLRRVIGLAAVTATMVAASVGSTSQQHAATPAADGASIALRGSSDLSVGKPTSKTTGVRPGTILRKHVGDVTVLRAGTVLENLDIHGFVDVKAPDVTIRNSVIRGGRATFNRGLITNYGHPNLLVVDVDIIPTYETVWQDGIKGSDFTARRVHIRGNVDSIKIQGDNVTVEDSLLVNTVWHASDPNQGGGPTHNDGIQIQKGSDVKIVRNNIRGHSNFAVLGAASIGDTPNLVVRGNWVDGGHCTVKLQEYPGHALAVRVRNNRFGPHRKVNCPLVATRGAQVQDAGNVLEESGRVVNVFWTNS